MAWSPFSLAASEMAGEDRAAESLFANVEGRTGRARRHAWESGWAQPWRCSGSVVGAGHDSIAVASCSMLRAAGRLVFASRQGARADLPRLGTQLVGGLLKELNKWKPVGSFRTTWLEETTHRRFRRFSSPSNTIGGRRRIRRPTTSARSMRTADSRWRTAMRGLSSAGGAARTIQFRAPSCGPRAGSIAGCRLVTTLISADSLRATLTAFSRHRILRLSAASLSNPADGAR